MEQFVIIIVGVPLGIISLYILGRVLSAGWHRGKLETLRKFNLLKEPKDGKE